MLEIIARNFVEILKIPAAISWKFAEIFIKFDENSKTIHQQIISPSFLDDEPEVSATAEPRMRRRNPL